MFGERERKKKERREVVRKKCEGGGKSSNVMKKRRFKHTALNPPGCTRSVMAVCETATNHHAASERDCLNVLHM